MSDTSNQKNNFAAALHAAASSPQLDNTRALTTEEARKIFEHSLEIVCIVNLHGIVLLANPAYERTLGYTVEEVQNFPSWLDIIHPDDQARAAAGLAEINNGITVTTPSQSSDIRCRCKDGSFKWISWTAVPMLEENKLFAIGRDVTNQKIAEAENRNLAAIVQSSSEAILGLDPNGRITSWNLGAEKLYGYKAEEVLGKRYNSLVQVDSSELLQGLLEECAQGRTLEKIETNHTSKFGVNLDLDLSLSQVLDEFGNCVGMSAIVHDVSHQKAAQKRIAEFYSMVSHELRTPLASIRGVLGLLEGGLVEPGSDESSDLIQIARSSCDRLVRLVNDILDMRKIESGTFEMDFSDLQARELLSLSSDSMAGMAQESSVTIKSEDNLPDGLMISGDRDRLLQVLINLISNAIKFSEPGFTVVISATHNPAEKSVRFKVQDSGPGISATDQGKLFQKFQQIDAGDARQKSGAGLGLAIAKIIVERHHGAIGLESEPGKGSTFWFELKAKDQ